MSLTPPISFLMTESLRSGQSSARSLPEHWMFSKKDKLLTVDEAAKMLSLAVPTVYKLVNQNKIPFMKRTKRLYFSEQRLNDWLLRSQTQTDDERFGAVDTYLVKRRSRKNNKRAWLGALL